MRKTKKTARPAMQLVAKQAEPADPFAATFKLLPADASAQRDAIVAIAPLAFSFEKSHSNLVSFVAVALGDKATDALKLAVTVELKTGRIAARMSEKFWTETVKIADAVARMDWVRDQINKPAAERHEGIKKPLNAANVWACSIFAATGHGKGKTIKQRNAQQKAKQTAKGKAETTNAPTHLELAGKSSALKTKAGYCAYIELLGAQMLARTNELAGVAPTSYAQAVLRFKADIEAAHKAEAEVDALRAAAANPKSKAPAKSKRKA